MNTTGKIQQYQYIKIHLHRNFSDFQDTKRYSVINQNQCFTVDNFREISMTFHCLEIRKVISLTALLAGHLGQNAIVKANCNCGSRSYISSAAHPGE